MIRVALALTVLVGGVVLPSCGGPCTYARTHGTARITSVGTPTGSGAVCSNDPVAVVFDFTPADASQSALAQTGERLLVSSGYDPPRSWVDAMGITVGSTHTATRMDITYGSCSPLEIVLDDADYQAGIDACFAH